MITPAEKKGTDDSLGVILDDAIAAQKALDEKQYAEAEDKVNEVVRLLSGFRPALRQLLTKAD
jgi:hypothetical protein